MNIKVTTREENNSSRICIALRLSLKHIQYPNTTILEIFVQSLTKNQKYLQDRRRINTAIHNGSQIFL
jgi:hypothetical protein